MLSKNKNFPCFWCFSAPPSFYHSCLCLNLRCLAIVFDLDETLIFANTLKSFEDRIESLRGWISREADMLVELKRYADDRAILKQYAETDCVTLDNGKLFKAQSEEVPQLSDSLEKLIRPIIRPEDKNRVLTRINPKKRSAGSIGEESSFHRSSQFELCQDINRRMSSRVTRTPVRGHRRRKATLNLDLNTEPPTDNRDHGGTYNLATSSQLETSVQGQAEHPATIDIEAIEDDVAVCSPTAFAEAKRKARRNRGSSEVVDVESDDLVVRLDPIIHKRRRGANATHQEIVFNDLYINLDRSNKSSRESESDLKLASSLRPSPKEPIFSCPICMGPFVEETSTKCGHIFCKTCISKAISGQTKCPTCRKKVVMKDLIRIFLPATTT